MPMPDGSDAELVAAALAGDKHAMGLLLERHRGLVVRLCARMLADDESARDAFQEAALRAMLGLDRLRDGERFAAWLCGIALNVCRDWLRSPGPPFTGWVRGGIRGHQLADPEPGPAELAEAAELSARVREAVAELPDGQREAVEAYYLSGLTSREVAVLLDTSIVAVKTRLFKARRALRQGPLAAKTEQHEETRPMTGTDQQLVPVTIAEIRQTPSDDTGRSHCIVLLTNADRDRHLCIWIGELEAAAIAFKLEDTQLPRPMAHELFVSAIAALDGQVEAVHIRELIDGTYYATLVLEATDGGTVELDARPSDALNIALIANAGIYAAPTLLEPREQEWVAEALNAQPVTARQIFDKMRPSSHRHQPTDTAPRRSICRYSTVGCREPALLLGSATRYFAHPTVCRNTDVAPHGRRGSGRSSPGASLPHGSSLSRHV